MSTNTDTEVASRKYFSESMRSDPKVLKVMGKRPHRKYLQVNREQFTKNVKKMASWDQYKETHKIATLMRK